MSWWRKPFTLIYVPHDGSNTRSISVHGVTFLVLVAMGGLFLGAGVFLSLAGMSSGQWLINQSELSSSVAFQPTDKTSGPQLHKTIASLRNELKKTQQQYEVILRISGFSDVAASEGTDLAKGDLKQVLEEASKELESASDRNRKLSRIQQYVSSRKKVFKNTPTLWPVEGWLSSPYGQRKDPMGGKGRSFHDGVDIAAWHGSPVRAPADAKVEFSGWKSGYGQVVVLKHDYGYTTLFGHLSRRLVDKGERVEKGAMIGRVGNSGHSTGSHVHYEVRVNEKPINPWPYLVENFESFKQYAMKEAP